MDKLKTLYITNRKDWRAWLEKNFDKEKEIWIIYPKKSSGKSRILYNDAVEEALCFGWIDSTVRRLDDERFAQRFSLRNPKTPYSQANKERLRQLLKKRRVLKALASTLAEMQKDTFSVPPEILEAFQAYTAAWKNIQ